MVEQTLVERLDEMTFSGTQMQQAIGASAATLTRQYMNYGVGLFTPNSSQGKRRDFVLADIMQLALAVWISQTTDRPKMGASILNQVAGFQGARRVRAGEPTDEHTTAIILGNEENARLRADAIKSIKALPALYWAEDRPIYLHIWPGLKGYHVLDEAAPAMRDGICLNATRYLNGIRLALAGAVEA